MIIEITFSIIFGIIMGILVPKIIIRIEDYYIRKKAIDGLSKNTFIIDGKEFKLESDERDDVYDNDEVNETIEEERDLNEKKVDLDYNMDNMNLRVNETIEEERDYEDKEEIRDYEQEEIDSGTEDSKQ
jgi:hypothetical protein